MLVMMACGKNGSPKTEDSSGRPSAPASPAPSAAAPATAPDSGSSARFIVKTPDDKRAVAVHIAGENVKIEIGDGSAARVLRGSMRGTGKRKYEIEGGPLIAEVKADNDAFKIRSADGKLLWKVKLAADKIKISDNEENLNPYVLKLRDDGWKVEENESSIGEVKFYADRGKIKVKDGGDAELFESNGDRPSAMYGVMLMKRIPETERAIIMAELAARGR